MNDEKDSDSNDSFLQKVSVAHEEDKVSLYADLFGIWAGGNQEIRCLEGKPACYLEDFKM